MSSFITVKEVYKYFGKSDPIKALGPVSFEVPKGSFTVILGRSGSGKSTLLNLMAGLDRVSQGDLIVNDFELSQSNGSKLAKYRSQIGIIFQFYNLLPNLNTIENVMMGGWAGGKKTSEEEATSLLKKFGLEHRIKADVKTLSGGEKQRVAICRSLVGNPSILFCDEPTGALDTANEKQVEEILSDLHKSGLTIVMVTHNPEFSSLADQVIYMKDGEIESIKTKS